MNVVDELIATAQPRTEKVPVCARGDLVAKHAQAVAELQVASSGDDSLSGSPETVAAAAAVKAVEDEMDAAAVEFTMTAIGREAWADLLAAYPPTKEERRAGYDHDPKRFPVVAVSECSHDPKVTLEQAEQLNRVLAAGEWAKLWLTVYGLNATPTPRPKLAAATDLLQANGPSSTTPPSEESLEVGSLAGSGEQ